MGFKHKQFTSSQAQCIRDMFIILAPKRGSESPRWGFNPSVTRQNFIDDAYNIEHGIVDADDNFFPASKLLNEWFCEQINTFSKKLFFPDSSRNDIPRPIALIRTPFDWTGGQEKDAMNLSRKDQFEYLVDRIKFLFIDDPDMGQKVMMLQYPI